MKLFTSNATFNYSWNEVSTAVWRKYCPWNDKSTHVVAVDTLSRNVDPDTGILRTERLITCHQGPPEWLRTLMGKSVCADGLSHIYEASYVDAGGHTVTMVSQNLTWSNFVSCQEKVVYRPQGNDKTHFEQSARITALCGGWNKIRNRIEDSLVNRFSENATKGKEGFERVLAMSRLVFDQEMEARRILERNKNIRMMV